MGTGDIMSILSKHGKSEDVCRWVIEHYDGNEMYLENKTVQQWVEDSKLVLEQLRLSY